MTIIICENGCGATSMDQKADIQTVSVVMRVNGEDDGAGLRSQTELCATCRNDIRSGIEQMFAKAIVKIEVTRKI